MKGHLLRFRPWKDYSNSQLLQTQGMGKTKEGRLEGPWLKAQDRSLWTGYVTLSLKWEKYLAFGWGGRFGAWAKGSKGKGLNAKLEVKKDVQKLNPKHMSPCWAGFYSFWSTSRNLQQDIFGIFIYIYNSNFTTYYWPGVYWAPKKQAWVPNSRESFSCSFQGGCLAILSA